MNSYPLISHRLYVAAIGHEGLHAKLRRNEIGSAYPATVRAIPLELMDGGKPMPGQEIRPLRAVGQRARS
jgi:hypothetical protein